VKLVLDIMHGSRAVRVMCGQGCQTSWQGLSHRGLVIKAPRTWAHSELKAYECLPRDKVGPKRWWEPDTSAEMTRGAP
jgi:hypothetical protein